jgi:hypothetical protein
MLLALELFLIGKLLAGGEHAVLRFEGRGVGPVGSGAGAALPVDAGTPATLFAAFAICTPATKPSR